MKTTLIQVLGCLLVLGWGCIPIGTAQAEDYANIPVILDMKDVGPKDIHDGKNYLIEPRVYNDGAINLYQLDTDYGPMNAESDALLRIRVTELNSMLIMEEMDRKKVFGDALVAGVKAPFQGAKALVTAPVETSKAIAKGTGQFFSNIGSAMFSDDPDQDNALKVAIGYDVAKRNFAYEFGINPYSTNEPVMARLGEIARAAVAGGITTKAAMAAADTDVMLAMRVTGTARNMQKLVRDNPPNKLTEINTEKLLKMKVPQEQVEVFLNNYNYDPYEETLLVGELETMGKVEHCAVFVSLVEKATTKRQAILYRHMAQMMAGYHRNIAPVSMLVNIAGVVTMQKKDGGLVVVTPVDYVFWTPKLEGKLKAFEETRSKLNLEGSVEWMITGKLDSSVKQKFKAKGWKLSENAGESLYK